MAEDFFQMIADDEDDDQVARVALARALSA
jgi:hypothetical protein